MLINETDEVARNGAFGKILRPEVFSDAPLHRKLRLSPIKVTPLDFPTTLPRRSSRNNGNRAECSPKDLDLGLVGFLPLPFFGLYRSAHKYDWFLDVDAGLAQ